MCTYIIAIWVEIISSFTNYTDGNMDRDIHILNLLSSYTEIKLILNIKEDAIFVQQRGLHVYTTTLLDRPRIVHKTGQKS